MIYLHIGLHKTATTSLQFHVFPNIDGVRFLGRGRGGIDCSHSLYKKLGKYVHSKNTDFDRERCLSSEFQRYVAYQQDILLSEEWFTADYSEFYGLKGALWQDKLTKLSRIFGCLDVKVLVTIRTPLDALYSQYCEFHRIGIQKRFPTFSDYMCKSNDASLFNYSDLNDLLILLFSDVQYLAFEKIKENRFQKSLRSYFGREKIPDLCLENSKRSDEKGVVVERSSWLVDMLRRNTSGGLRKKLKHVSGLRCLTKWLTRLKPRAAYVSPLSTADVELFDSKFIGASKFYKSL